MLEVLYEDNHIIAVNKKISDIVQADKTGDTPLSEEVKAYIKKKYNKPGEVYLGIPHRVDRPVSGVVIFARTSKALTRLNKMFQEHEKEISKIYWAIVGNLPAEDHAVLTHYLMRDPEKNKSHAYNQPKAGAKEATLEYKLLGSSQRYYLLEVKLYTGRFSPFERRRRDQFARPFDHFQTSGEPGNDHHHGKTSFKRSALESIL